MKICPLMSFRSRQEYQIKISCLENDCALWDNTFKRCSLGKWE